MKKFLLKIFKPKNFIFLIVFLLFLSFTLHTLQIKHDHPAGMMGEGTQVVTLMHNKDEKWWLVVLALSFFLMGTRIIDNFKRLLHSMSHLTPNALFFLKFIFPKLYDPTQTGLAQGIIHPKIFE